MNGASNPAEERLDNDYADLDCQAAVDESETGSVDQSESISSKQLSLQELPPRPKTPEDINSKSNEIGKIVEALKQIGKQNEYLKNGLDETKNKTNNVSWSSYLNDLSTGSKPETRAFLIGFNNKLQSRFRSRPLGSFRINFYVCI